MLEAIRLYQEARREDPYHAAMAQVGLAESYAFLALCGFSTHETLPRVREWAAEAIVSDPGGATSFAILGFITGAYDWNWTQADQLFYKALALAPQATEVRCWYADHLICTRRFSEAVRQARKAQTLEHEPSGVVLSHVAKILYASGDLDSALEVLQLSLQINPNFHISHELLGLLPLDCGDGDAGLAHFHTATELAPESSSAIAGWGYSLAVLVACRREIVSTNAGRGV